MKSSYNGGGGMNTGRRNTGTSSMRQSTSVGHLSSFGGDGNSLSRQVNSTFDNEDDDGSTMQGKKIKRTKSMWKFKKSGSSDEVLLTGMSMWKHRSLVDVNAAEAEEQQQLQHNNGYNNKSSAGTPVANKKFTVASRDIDIAADDEDSQTIMNGGGGGGSSTVRRMTYDNRKQQPQQQQQQQQLLQSRSRRSSSSSFGGGDDSESCIVVDDHLKDVRSAPPAPASLLPRTRLIKQTAGKDGQGNGGMQQKHHHHNNHNQQPANMLIMMPPPPPPPPAVRTATVDDGYAPHDSDTDVRFESSKLQTFKYINATHNDSWYDSWGEKRKK